MFHQDRRLPLALSWLMTTKFFRQSHLYQPFMCIILSLEGFQLCELECSLELYVYSSVMRNCLVSPFLTTHGISYPNFEHRFILIFIKWLSILPQKEIYFMIIIVLQIYVEFQIYIKFQMHMDSICFPKRPLRVLYHLTSAVRLNVTANKNGAYEERSQ